MRFLRHQITLMQNEFDALQANVIAAMPPDTDRMVWVDRDEIPWLVMLVRDDPKITIDVDKAQQLLNPDQFSLIHNTKTFPDVELVYQAIQEGDIDRAVVEKFLSMTIPTAKLRIVHDKEAE